MKRERILQMKISEKIFEAIHKSKNVAIFTHMRPDADALGSSCAMKMYLEKMGKSADIYVDAEDISLNYNFIKGVSKVNYPALKEYDTAIALDCGDFGRLGKYGQMYQSIETRLNIDHHITNDNYGQINCVIGTSSTGEIVYAIFKSLHVAPNRDIATALYSAIASDTGCFQHGNTNANTYKVVGQLFKYKIDINKANYYLFKRRSWGQVMLMQAGLKNLKMFLDGRLAIMYLKASNFKECGVGNNESFGLVDYCVNIEKVEVGILISEIKPNLYAVSIRGKGKVDCSKLAIVFGGGGHPDAAGCNIFGSCNSVIGKLVRATSKYIC